MLRLPELQRAFLRAITGRPAGAAAASVLLDEIRGDQRLAASARVDVYAGMYHARLLDVLAEDYPRVAATLGPERFATVARAYVVAHPSRHPSLRWFGRDFGAFLAGMSRELPAFAADLARLEWARLAVFDAPDAEALELDALRRVSPQDWGELRLRTIPAALVLPLGWPAHRIWEATSLEETAEARSEWQPEDTCLRVWRQDGKVYQAAMDGIERTALASVQAGDSFSTLCEGLATIAPAETAAEAAAGLVLRWIDDGMLAALASTPPR